MDVELAAMCINEPFEHGAIAGLGCDEWPAHAGASSLRSEHALDRTCRAGHTLRCQGDELGRSLTFYRQCTSRCGLQAITGRRGVAEMSEQNKRIARRVLEQLFESN